MKRTWHSSKGFLVSAVLAVWLLGGCASTKPPAEEITTSTAAVRQAEQVGAREHAPLEFRTAVRKLEQSRAAASDGEYKKARRLAEQAQVDAELAAMKARSVKAQQAAREIRESIRTLREEIERRDRGNQ